MDLRSLSGSIAAVTEGAPIAASAPMTGTQLRFLTGIESVPPYLATMLAGIETERYTREEAIREANRRTEMNFINRAMWAGRR